jgi:hypothetical protein
MFLPYCPIAAIIRAAPGELNLSVNSSRAQLRLSLGGRHDALATRENARLRDASGARLDELAWRAQTYFVSSVD